MRKTAIIQSLLTLFIIAGAGCSAGAHAAFLNLGEDRLYFEESGEGFPLILVSGGSGMDLRQWHAVIPTLSENYRVIAYDPRGIGRSDIPSVPYSDTADLTKLLDHLDVDRIGLVGLSSSGGFVLEFAIQYPQRISGIVAAAPFVPGFEFGPSMMARLNLFNQTAQQGREPFLDSMFDDAFFIPAPLDRAVRVAARENMAENYDKGVDFDPSLPISLEPPLIEQLSRIRSPLLLLVGELDHPEVMRRNQFLLDNISTASEKTIADAGHNAPQENPRAFLTAIADFLNKIED